MTKQFLIYMCAIAIAAAVFCQVLYKRAADRDLVDQLVVAGQELAANERTAAGDARAAHALLLVCEERDLKKIVQAEKLYFEVELKKLGIKDSGVGMTMDRMLEGLLFSRRDTYPYPFIAEGANLRLPQLQQVLSGKFSPLYDRLNYLEKTLPRRDLSQFQFLKNDPLARS